MVSFVIDIGDPAVLQIGSIIWIVRDSRRTREELVSIGHIAEDNAMEASNAADSFIRNHAGVSDHVPATASTASPSRPFLIPMMVTGDAGFCQGRRPRSQIFCRVPAVQRGRGCFVDGDI
jgi:hypothetical protein